MTFTIIDGAEETWLDIETLDELCELYEHYGRDKLLIDFCDMTITIIHREEN